MQKGTDLSKMAASARQYHVWVGAESGALKAVNLRRKEAVNYGVGPALGREAAVSVLSWGDSEGEVLLGRSDRSVQRLDTRKGTLSSARSCPGGEGDFCGIAAHGRALITCVQSGLIKVWHEDSAEDTELFAGGGLCRMRQDPTRPQRLGTAGKENGLKVWDLQQPGGGPLFRAKNVPNDWLDLRVPIWDRDFCFVPGTEQLLTCTAYGQVRLYDSATPRRRPVLQVTYGEGPLTALALAPGGTSVVVGSARGDMAVIDLRQGRLLKCLKGIAGSVRGLQCHPSLPLVASCGLDRFLRLHNLDDKRLLHKVYLKSRLNCLLLSSCQDLEAEDAPPPAVKEEEEDGDALWDSMETISARKRAPKRKSSGL